MHRLLSIAVVASLSGATTGLADGRSCIDSALRAGSVQAAPFVFKAAEHAPEIELRGAPSFVLAHGVEGQAQAACLPGKLGEDLLAETVTRALAEAELDPQIAIVLTSAPLSCSALFYLPIANDVRGIGYQHEDAREVFDDSPDSRLEGLAFLNDWPYWRDRPDEFATAFLHEVGHRWGARVHARIEGEDSDELLGRQRKHWSYFVDTAGSPLEGNRFRELGGARFEASTRFGTGAFSPLDLYLMGVLSPEEVEPFSMLRAASAELRDCKDFPLGRASPPQFCEPLELEAEHVEVSIADIVAVEGAREPAAEDVAHELDVAVIVLSSDPDKPLHREDCAQLSEALDAHVDAFERATGERMRLINVARSRDATCESWSERPAPSMPAAASCATLPAVRSSWSAALALVAALVLGVRRRTG